MGNLTSADKMGFPSCVVLRSACQRLISGTPLFGLPCECYASVGSSLPNAAYISCSSCLFAARPALLAYWCAALSVCNSKFDVCTHQPVQGQLNEEHARQYDAPGAAPGNTLEMHSVAEERFVAATIFGLTGSPAGMQMLLQDDAASLTGAACLWDSSCPHQWLLKGGVPQSPH